MEKADIRIRCIFNADTGEFGGMAEWPNAGYSGPVTGRLPTWFFEKKEPPIKRGRPKAIKKDMTALMVTSMAKELLGLSRQQARLKAAEILSIGDHNNPDNVIRAMIRYEKKANEIFNKSDMGGDAVLWSGDDTRTDAPGPSLIIMDKTSRPRLHEESGRWLLSGDGYGWWCDWGSKQAKYGKVAFSAVLDKKPVDESLIKELSG